MCFRNLQLQCRTLSPLCFIKQRFCYQFHSYGCCDHTAILPHKTHRGPEWCWWKQLYETLSLPYTQAVFCVDIHVLFENRKMHAYVHTQEEQTANQRRNTWNLKFPGTLSFWLQSGQFFAMTSHIGILYKQTHKLAHIITHLYINVCANNVT